jgi:phosphatidylglycerophosphatase A
VTRLAIIVATFGYIGLFPIAPGTAGSFAGLIVYFLIPKSPVAAAVTIVALLVGGAWSGTVAERYFGTIDPGPVVVDEVMGMLITLYLVPVTVSGAIVGFVLFRITDVIKPYPAARFERLPGGWGVMADDAMAAVYANLALRAAAWMFPLLRQ